MLFDCKGRGAGMLRKSQPIKKGKLQPAFDGVFRGWRAVKSQTCPIEVTPSSHKDLSRHTPLVHSPRVSHNLERLLPMYLSGEAQKCPWSIFRKRSSPSPTSTKFCRLAPMTGKGGGGNR